MFGDGLFNGTNFKRNIFRFDSTPCLLKAKKSSAQTNFGETLQDIIKEAKKVPTIRTKNPVVNEILRDEKREFDINIDMSEEERKAVLQDSESRWKQLQEKVDQQGLFMIN